MTGGCRAKCCWPWALGTDARSVSHQESLPHPVGTHQRAHLFEDLDAGPTIDNTLPAEDADGRARAESQLRRDLAGHVKDIRDKYLIPGETQDTAFLFVPSESLFASASVWPLSFSSVFTRFSDRSASRWVPMIRPACTGSSGMLL